MNKVIYLYIDLIIYLDIDNLFNTKIASTSFYQHHHQGANADGGAYSFGAIVLLVLEYPKGFHH